jgi:hypothetical protein
MQSSFLYFYNKYSLRFCLNTTISKLNNSLHNKSLFNISNRMLSSSEHTSLSYGRNFIFSPRHPTDKYDSLISSNFDRFERSLSWSYFWHTKGVNRPPPKVYERTNTPIDISDTQPIGHIVSQFIREVKFNFISFLRSAINTTTRSNFPLMKHFLNIIRDDTIVVAQTDKNLGTIVLNKTHYNDLIFDHLNDPLTYKLISLDEANKQRSFFELELLSIVLPLIRDADSIIKRVAPGVRDNYHNFFFSPTCNSLFSYFRVLIKVHKGLPYSGRPIVSLVNQFTRPLSIWVHKTLDPIVKGFSDILRDRLPLISSLEHTTCPPDFVLLTADVTSLYPSIDTNLGVNTVIDFLTHLRLNPRLYPDYSGPPITLPTIKALKRALPLVLNNNIICYDGALYLQIKGTAMGSSLAPSYAQLFLFARERELVLSAKQKGQILIYKRYIDDIFACVHSSYAPVFISDYNKLTEGIRVTHIINESHVDYLDLSIHISQPHSTFYFKAFSKPFQKWLYNPGNSDHAPHTKSAFIKAELIRLALCSTFLSDFHISTKRFSLNLHARNYPIDLILKVFDTVSHSIRDTYILRARNLAAPPSPPPLRRSYLVIPFTPSMLHVNSIFSDPWASYGPLLSTFTTIPAISFTCSTKLGALITFNQKRPSPSNL